METLLALLVLAGAALQNADRSRDGNVPVAVPGLESIETRFQQVYPLGRDRMERTPGRTRAVLLLHGLGIHPLNNARVYEPLFHDWQLPGSTLVKALGKDADVFAYAYSQNTRIEKVAQTPALAQAIGKLRFLGYPEIILLGHSTGGVVARLFVEDYPRSGVTKVVQVCAPNDGSSWAKLNFSVAKDQELFLHSLTKKERLVWNELRDDKRIPGNVDFLCVVGATGLHGDGMVSCKSQWSPDLQKQGIPAVRLTTTHLTVLRAPKTVDKVAELVREDHPRWSAEKVQAMRKSIMGGP
jgi:pimeloyl-ACP methyl ester carboxylesterase